MRESLETKLIPRPVVLAAWLAPLLVAQVISLSGVQLIFAPVKAGAPAVSRLHEAVSPENRTGQNSLELDSQYREASEQSPGLTPLWRRYRTIWSFAGSRRSDAERHEYEAILQETYEATGSHAEPPKLPLFGVLAMAAIAVALSFLSIHGSRRHLQVLKTSDGQSRMVEDLLANLRDQQRLPDDLDRAIWSSSPVNMAWLSPELKILRISDQGRRFFGLDEATEKHCSLESALKSLQIYLQFRDAWHGCITIETTDGPGTDCLCNVALSADRAKYLAVFHELEAETNYGQSKTANVRGIAHDLRGALTSVFMGLELILVANEAPDQLAENFATVKSRVLRTTTMFENYLALERVVYGRVDAERHTVDCFQILDAAVDQTLTQLSANLTVTMEEECPATIHADPYQLTEAFANLLLWSVSIADPDEEITCRARSQNDEVVIVIDILPDPPSVHAAPAHFGMVLSIVSNDLLAQQSLYLSNKLFTLHGITLSTRWLDNGRFEIVVKLPCNRSPQLVVQH